MTKDPMVSDEKSRVPIHCRLGGKSHLLSPVSSSRSRTRLIKGRTERRTANQRRTKELLGYGHKIRAIIKEVGN